MSAEWRFHHFARNDLFNQARRNARALRRSVLAVDAGHLLSQKRELLAKISHIRFVFAYYKGKSAAVQVCRNREIPY
jgi:hypothetical protein